MDRIDRLEERMAELLRVADDLSEVMARQAGEIEVLQRRVRLLMEREAEREAMAGAAPEANVPPPHW